LEFSRRILSNSFKMTVKVVKTVAAEFRVRNCYCHHEAPQEFLQSQWQRATKSTLFFIYRLVFAIFFTVCTLYSIISHGIKNGAENLGYFFIALTNWGICLCMICSIYGFILVAVWYYHPEYSQKIDNQQEMPKSFKFYWIIHNTSLIMSVLITVMYWSVVYNPENDQIDAKNILTHVTNSIVMFIDLIIVAFPVRLAHCLYPIVFGVSYGVFSYIYYVCGGTSLSGNRYVYKVLDWGHPGQSMIVVVGVLTLGLILHFCLFLIYRLRVFAYKRLFVSSTSNKYSTNSPEAVKGVSNAAYISENNP